MKAAHFLSGINDFFPFSFSAFKGSWEIAINSRFFPDKLSVGALKTGNELFQAFLDQGSRFFSRWHK